MNANTVTTLDMSALTNRPRRFIHRDLVTLLDKLVDAGLVGTEIGDKGLLRWFNRKASCLSYWVAGEYHYVDARNRKQTALYLSKDFLLIVIGRIDCDVARRLYVSMV